MHDLKVTLYSPGQGADMQHARASAWPVRIPVRTQNSELRTACMQNSDFRISGNSPCKLSSVKYETVATAPSVLFPAYEYAVDLP